MYKLYRATRTGPHSPIDPKDQVAFYDPGLGTITTAGLVRLQVWEALKSLGRERESLETALKQARTELSVAQRDLATQTGRADALERQLLASPIRTARGASKPVPRAAPTAAAAPKPRRARTSR